ncbi:hypothetical protein [Alkalicoccus daliensis]|uniref:Uncharacterized protein n=1 Tax=Alkalicoccus daliensis TaxID=745820 RepID=A0A1H0GAR1_9BACI|nr:hypothetical protein [Alkalicoccus daliensis]SDO03972.1 hypothetical protein SAMN04488053_10639 [Alkalicoccus daliensis]
MSFEERKNEIITEASEQALRFSFQKEHLWYLDDLRNNFYFAMHLYAGAHNKQIKLSAENADAENLAEKVILRGLRMQERDPESSVYGHWPLNLEGPEAEISAHPLPAELLTSLFLTFYSTYKDTFSPALLKEFHQSFKHLYTSDFLHREPDIFSHHEAKLFCNQLMLGQHFHDNALYEKGFTNMEALFQHLKTNGFREYGALPWVWHWIQAVSFAKDFISGSRAKTLLENVLNYLWEERAEYYLKGTWIGAHSRNWSHDISEDRNNVIDYIQFGDFDSPKHFPRLEGAGFLTHQVAAAVYKEAVSPDIPKEIKKKIFNKTDPDNNPEVFHHYIYKTADFALGGLWERAEEFDNEQHRWDVTLPLPQEGVNQAYFFQPGEGFSMEDPRHESPGSDVLFYKNTAAAIFDLTNSEYGFIIGVLPKGEWLTEDNRLYGKAGTCFFFVQLLHPFSIEEKHNRMQVKSSGARNAIIMEVFTTSQAAERNIHSVQQWKAQMEKTSSPFHIEENTAVTVNYKTFFEDALYLKSYLDQITPPEHTINNSNVDFYNYYI